MFVKTKNEKTIEIIMLDSEERLLNAVKNYFCLKKFHILITSKPCTAWAHLEKNLPDCLVVDIAMPNNEGYDFIRSLKKNNDFQHIPFIFLTAKGLTEDRILGYRLGCSAYVSKPFDPEELESIIKNIVEKNDLFINSILDNYFLIKNIKLNLAKKYRQYIEHKLQLSLTLQEHCILNQILLGNKTHRIALNLNVSKRNVEKYISRLLDKIKVKTTYDLKFLFWNEEKTKS